MRHGFNFIVLHMFLQFSQYHLLKRLSFTHWVFLVLLLNINWPYNGGSDSKESTCSAGDLGLIPGLGRSPRGGHGIPLQYSCLENPRGQRSLVGYNPWGHKELDTSEWLSTAHKIPEFNTGHFNLFHWSLYLFLGWYHIICITMDLKYNFKSGSVVSPALFFFLRISLAIQGLLWLHAHCRIVSSICVKDAFSILMRIALNL